MEGYHAHPRSFTGLVVLREVLFVLSVISSCKSGTRKNWELGIGRIGRIKRVGRRGEDLYALLGVRYQSEGVRVCGGCGGCSVGWNLLELAMESIGGERSPRPERRTHMSRNTP